MVCNMTVEDIKEYKKNAVEILIQNSQYATAKATEEAFDVLLWFEEIKGKLSLTSSYNKGCINERFKQD
jgi:hypothetical protein